MSISNIHDRGVFATRPYKKGEYIEKAPFVPVPADQFLLLRGTCVHFYYFLTGNSETPAVLGLGMASLYNHSCPSSAAYEIDMRKKLIYFRAVRSIQEGEEITINYNGTPDDPAPVTFNTPE